MARSDLYLEGCLVLKMPCLEGLERLLWWKLAYVGKFEFLSSL